VWGPVFGLFLESSGRRVLREWVLYTVAIVDLAAAGLWYWHAHRLGQMTGLSFGMLDKAFDPSLVFSVRFYVDIAARLAKDILGPAGAVAAAVGLVIAARRRLWPELFAAAGFCAYIVLVATGNKVHDYYQIAVVPTAVMLIAIGVTDGLRALRLDERSHALALTSVLAVMLLSTFVRSVSFHSWYEHDPDRVQLCRDLQPQLAPRALVAFFDYPSPDLLFCLDRHGWLFAAGRWSADDVTSVWKQGADVIVLPAPLSQAALPEAMRDRSVLIARSGHLSAYRVEPFDAQPPTAEDHR
jgi:hypothetical protein